MKNKNTSPKPLFGTREWAEKNENLISGCSHDCAYCYAKATAVQYKKNTSGNWKNEVIRDPYLLEKKFRKRNYRLMIPSTHDITPQHLKENLIYLGKILAPGNEILIVSKPHLDCVKSMCDAFNPFKENILFRFTIGSADSNTLKSWEPGAPAFEERLESLIYAYEHGYKTSVSCEPMLDDLVEKVIEATLTFITDSIWIGKPNKLIERLSMNGFKNGTVTMSLAGRLMEALCDEYIWCLYERYGDNPKIKWKESCKKVLGIEIPTEVGLDE